jgi:formate hydrogenlyase subunit 3/multisubunit Na+/H+ antiporter MnhD subunit
MNANVLLIPVMLPLVGGIFFLLIPKKIRWFREVLAILIAALSTISAFLIFFREIPDLHYDFLEFEQFNLHLDMITSPMSGFILIFITGFVFLVSIYSLSYFSRDDTPKEYPAFILFALGGSCGVVTADHFLLFLIFWEIVTVSLYFLICTGGKDARKGATKTFAMLGGADGCLILGIGLCWFMTKSFTISSMNIPISGWMPGIAFLLMMIGAIAKAGAIPLHTWIPAAADSAPPPVMAILPASIDKLLGIFLLVRISTSIFIITPGLGLALMVIGAITIIAAVMIAMVQHDLRCLLSYHAISQVGYMVLGIGTMNPIGLAGALFHMLNNSIYKNCLFLSCGAIKKRTGTTNLGNLGGLAKVMPLTFTACLISSLAISGVPPFNGFTSKWLIYQGILETGMNGSYIFLVAAMFGSVLTLASFLKVIYSVFLGPKTRKTEQVEKEVPATMAVPMLFLAFLCFLFGVWYALPMDKMIKPAISTSVIIAGSWNSTMASLLIAAGIILGLFVYLLGRLRKSARVVESFTGGEKLDNETGRINGTHFYLTIRDMPFLHIIYDMQEKGFFDPYNWLGRLGGSITWVLRKIHNGMLSWYLSWSLAGIVILLGILFFM